MCQADRAKTVAVTRVKGLHWEEARRRKAYRLLAEQVNIREFTLEERMELVENGLEEKSEESTEEVRELLMTWFQQCDDSIVTLLQLLDLGRTVDIEKKTRDLKDMAVVGGPAQVVWLIIDTLRVQDHGPRKLVRRFKEQFLDHSSLIPFSELSRENVLYWRMLVVYLKTEQDPRYYTRKYEELLWSILPNARTFYFHAISYILGMEEAKDWKLVSIELLSILVIYIISTEDNSFLLYQLRNLPLTMAHKFLEPMIKSLLNKLEEQEKEAKDLNLLIENVEKLGQVITAHEYSSQVSDEDKEKKVLEERKLEREKAKQEMSNEKINEIVKLLESSSASNKTEKSKKRKKGKKIKNNIEKSQKIQNQPEPKKPEEITEANSKEMNRITQDELRKSLIKEKLITIKVQRDQCNSIVQTKSKEISALRTTLEDKNKQQTRAFAEIAAIDATRAELLKESKERGKTVEKLEKKLKTAEDLILKTANNSNDVITTLEKEVEELEAKPSFLQPTDPPKPADLYKQLNHEYLESISLKISSKEVELECPVCLELASAPIYMCLDQHLVCSGCRPKISSCPECRQPYTDGGAGARAGAGAGA